MGGDKFSVIADQGLKNIIIVNENHNDQSGEIVADSSQKRDNLDNTLFEFKRQILFL